MASGAVNDPRGTEMLVAWRRGLAAGGVLLIALSLSMAASGQVRPRWGDQIGRANIEYNGRFAFSRIRYRSGNAWAHDYPRADLHLPRLLDELTAISANVDGSNVFDLDDPDLFLHPVIYLSEPGFWRMSEAEVQGLRNYLLKGGFIIFDDFEAEQWYNFEAQVKRALPEYRLMEIDVEHPIFHAFFDMKALEFPHPLVRVTPRYYGLFEDNDPRKRMLAIVNYNNDLAEYWEWSATGLFPVDFTNEAYKLGVNYMVYAMTH